MWISGIDWAVESRNRAAVILETSPTNGAVRVVDVAQPVTDAYASQLCRNAASAVVAVDTPFGWPAEFSDFVARWRADGVPGQVVPDSARFRFRLTDSQVWEQLGKCPLSVSADRIGLAARTWVELLQREGLADTVDPGCGRETGTGPTLIEVYPGATLAAVYGPRPEVVLDGYKKDPEARRQRLAHQGLGTAPRRTSPGVSHPKPGEPLLPLPERYHRD